MNAPVPESRISTENIKPDPDSFHQEAELKTLTSLFTQNVNLAHPSSTNQFVQPTIKIEPKEEPEYEPGDVLGTSLHCNSSNSLTPQQVLQVVKNESADPRPVSSNCIPQLLNEDKPLSQAKASGEIVINNPHKRTDYSCLHCGITFKYLDELGIHHLRHESVKMIKFNHNIEAEGDTICLKKYGKISKIHSAHLRLAHHDHDLPVAVTNMHLHKCKTSTGKQKTKSMKLLTYKCEQCGKTFNWESAFKDHIFLHTGKKPHKCNQCSKSFSMNYYLKKHLFLHTGKKPHKCSQCPKSFSTNGDLKKHLFLHTGKKPHKCSQCSKSFPTKGDLKKHIFIHSGKKPHKCNRCGASFCTKQQLDTHSSIHTGEKPHLCGICGKVFRLKFFLTEHIRTHSVEKPHACRICGKCFRRKHHINSHMLVHSEEKPHKCIICKKSFTLKVNMKKHMLLHTGRDKPYKCTLCVKVFC